MNIMETNLGISVNLCGISERLEQSRADYFHNYENGKIIGEQKAQEAPLTEYLEISRTNQFWQRRFQGRPYSSYTLHRISLVLDKLFYNK